MPNETTPIVESGPSRSPTLLGDLMDHFKGWPMLELFFLCYMAVSGAVGTTVTYTRGQSSTSMGIDFFSQACGGIFGGILAEILFRNYQGNIVLIATGILLGGVLISIPFIDNDYLMNTAYFGVGAFSIIIQIGCVHMVRRIQQETAGHWLALTQAANSGGSGLFYLLYWRLNLTKAHCYTVLSIIVWIVSLALIAVPFSAAARTIKRSSSGRTTTPDPSGRTITPIPKAFYNTTQLDGQEPDDSTRCTKPPEDDPTSTDPTINPPSNEMITHDDNILTFSPPHYWVEIIVGFVTAFSNYCGLVFTSYFYAYVEQSGVEPTTFVDAQITIFWATVTLGRLIGSIDQYCYINDYNIIPHILLWIGGGVITATMWLILWQSELGVWITTALLGFFVGPLVGYIYDLVHRLTLPSEASTTILTLVTFAGGRALMYACSLSWNAGAGPRSLIASMVIALLLAMPCVIYGKDISYLKKFKIVEYESVPTSEC